MTTWAYIKSDLIRYTGKYSLLLLIKNLCRNRSFIYSFWLRFSKHNNFFISTPSKCMHKLLSNRYFIQIPFQTEIGYGLYIGHYMCMVIHPSTKIGNNVNLSQFTTIGSNNGKAAIIGDNVYIGPNVCIIENVIIGDNSSIGAGSVVTKNVPENATVAGVPAKVLSYNSPGRYVNNRWSTSN